MEVDGRMSTVERWGGTTVLVADEAGPALDGRAFRDLIGDAMGEGADLLAVPVARMAPDFWELASGVAGDLLQVTVNYGVVLAIVGEVPEPSRLVAGVRGAGARVERGSQHWFVPSLDALRAMLAGSSRSTTARRGGLGLGSDDCRGIKEPSGARPHSPMTVAASPERGSSLAG